jgi:hypothetical protein
MDQSTLLAHKQSQMEKDLPDNAAESIAPKQPNLGHWPAICSTVQFTA